MLCFMMWITTRSERSMQWIRGESPDADYTLQSEKENSLKMQRRGVDGEQEQSMEDSKDDPRENIRYLPSRGNTGFFDSSRESSSPLLIIPTISDDEDEVCLIVRCSNKSERDQWIDTIKGGLFSVRSSTVETRNKL